MTKTMKQLPTMRELAAGTLLEAGIERLPVKLETVARRHDILMFTYKQYAEAAGVTIAEISQRYGSDGFTQKMGQKLIIFYRQSGNLRRVRWTVAHELAHILLGHLDGGTHYNADKHADDLAAELLCPEAVVLACGCSDSDGLAELCDISPSAARVVWRKGLQPICKESYREQELLDVFEEFIWERKRKGAICDGETELLPKLRSHRI